MTYKMILFASASGAAMLLASAASAQTTPSPKTDAAPADTAASVDSDATQEIIVTGISASLSKAAAIKRDSPAIVDAISAEDIGRFPDQNLADSLQRVTGVQITRSRGEGNQISVRGLSPDFTRIQYNGRTITSTGSRSFDFGSLTSDFVNSVEVYKTPTSDMIEGGLSATVNVATARPLDYGKDRYVIALEAIYEPNAKKVGPHATAYVSKMLGDDVGVYLGVDYQKRQYQIYNQLGFGFETACESVCAGPNNTVIFGKNPAVDYNRDGRTDGTFSFDHAAGITVQDGYRGRLTAIAGVQARLTDSLELFADMFYANLRDKSNFIQFAGRFTDIQGPVRASTVSGSVVTSLDADGVDIANNSQPNTTTVETISPAIGLTWKQDRWTIKGQADFSRSTTIVTDLGLSSRAHLPFSYDARPDGSNVISYAFPARFTGGNVASNYGSLGLSGAYKQPTYDRNYQFRLDASYDIDSGFLRKFSAGGSYSNRRLQYVSSFLAVSAGQLAGLLGVPTRPSSYGGLEFDIAPYLTLYSFPNAFSNYSGPAKFPTTFLSSNLDLLFAKLPLAKIASAVPPVKQTASEYSVDEATWAAYARLDFASGDDRFGGNLGVRYVRTDQQTNGTVTDFNTIVFTQQGSTTFVTTTPGTAQNVYSRWLPSINVHYDLGPDLLFRFGAARAMARAPLSLLSTSTTINANVSTINSSNPQLRPYTADQADLSLEYYFRKTGLLSVAGFYKNLHDYVVNGTRSETYTVTNRESGVASPVTFKRFLPTNGDDVKLKGVEIAAQVPLSIVAQWADGFGIGANATFLDVGKVALNGGGQLLPIPGVSSRTYNASAYFEKYGIGARVTYTYRSGYANDQSSYFGDGDLVRAYGQLDGSLSYDVNRNIALTLDLSNLTNTPLKTFNSLGYARTFTNQGRRFQLSARARF
jgi:iron complex outermembrane recepter protein